MAWAPIRRPFIEGMIDSPPRIGSVENEDLCALRSLRAGSILPIAITGIELAAVAGKETHLGAPHETTRTVPRTRREGKLKFISVARGAWDDASREHGANSTQNQRAWAPVKITHRLVLLCTFVS